VAVVQDGARLHYALPLALQRRGLLERVFTLWYTAPGSAAAWAARALRAVAPALGRRASDRHHPELDAARVASHPALLLRQRWARRRFPTDEAFFHHCARLEADWILRAGWGRADTLAGFVRNLHPDLCRAARADGLRVVIDQMCTPAPVQEREVQLQARRWPGWEPAAATPRHAREFERDTWANADHITCPSEYVRDGLLGEGVAPERISVCPYPVAATEFRPVERAARCRPLTVGFVGRVNLWKGAPYFFEVARRLASPELRFVMVGPVSLRPEAAARPGGAVELVGPTPRTEVAGWLERFDIFYFPSTCEGSAGAVMEAMMCGLPVVTSPNSGSVVRDGVEGYVTAYDDVEGAAARIERLARDADLRWHMGRAARSRAAIFDLAHNRRSLVAAYERPYDRDSRPRGARPTPTP
jgi:glycosyltransferase involved in cell wall biosynthesis